MNVSTIKHIQLSESADNITASILFDVHEQQLPDNKNNDQNTWKWLQFLVELIIY